MIVFALMLGLTLGAALAYFDSARLLRKQADKHHLDTEIRLRFFTVTLRERTRP